MVEALDVEDLIDYFGERKKSKSEKEQSAAESTAVAKKKKAKIEKAQLVDGKTEQNVGLAIARIRVANLDLVDAILSVDDTIVTPELAGNLTKCIPTSDQGEACRGYEGDPRGLSKVECFFRDISTIPALKGRLDAVKYIANFDSDVELLEESAKTVRNALSQLVEGKKFDQLLRLLLAIGNFMNGTKGAGGCSGFKMDSLKKLDETRTQASSPHKLTLTMYLVRVARRGITVSATGTSFAINEESIALDEDWPTLETASKINFAQVRAYLSVFSAALLFWVGCLFLFSYSLSTPAAPGHAAAAQEWAEEDREPHPINPGGRP